MTVDLAAEMEKLVTDASGVSSAADEMRDLMQRFESSGEGEAFRPGIQLTYESLLAQYANEVYEAYENDEKRPPSEAIREARAQKRIKDEYPDLYADYHRISERLKNIQKWVALKKETLSPRQTVITTERELAR